MSIDLSITKLFKIESKHKYDIIKLMNKNMHTDVFIEKIKSISFSIIRLYNINPKKHRNGFVISVLTLNDKLPTACSMVFENERLTLYKKDYNRYIS